MKKIEVTNTNSRDTAIYEDVMEFVRLESEEMGELYSDEVKDLVYTIVTDMDEGHYSTTEFVDNPNIIEWFEEVILGDYEQASSLSYQEAIYLRELLVNYVRDRYMDGEYAHEEDYYDDED